MAADCVSDIVSSACREPTPPARCLGTALDAALEFLAAEPALARLLGAEVPAAVPAIAALRAELVARLASLLASIRRQPRACSSERERLLVEGAFAFLSDRLLAAGPAALPALGPELTELFLPLG